MPAPHPSSGKRSTRKGETSANHLISFQYRPPQQLVSPPLGSTRHGGGGRRHAPLDPEKVKVAYRLLTMQYLLYPDIAAAAMQHAGPSPPPPRAPETPTQATGVYHPGASVLPAKLQSSSSLTLGKDAARAIMNYDGIVSWDHVYAVVLRRDYSDDINTAVGGASDTFQHACPICLEVPCAPRITPCGHVYCLPCILRFLMLQKEEQHQRTCPVCHATLVQKQLKRVLFQAITPVKERSRRTFVLVHRAKNSPLVLAHTDAHLCDAATSHDGTDAGSKLVLPRYEDDRSSQFCRYSIATEDLHGLHQVIDESALEERRLEYMSSLTTLPMTRDEALEVKALEESLLVVQRYAFEYAHTRQQQTQATAAQLSHSASGTSPTAPGGFQQHHSPSQRSEQRQLSATSMSPDPTAATDSGGSPFDTAPPMAASSSDQQTSPPQAAAASDHHAGGGSSAPYYDLYMDAEGQPIFLHFVCTKMILDDCRARGVDPPCSIDVDVLDIETVVQSDQTRAVLKPLAFIPLCGSVRTVFCDMKKGLVGPQTIKAFKEVLDRRMQRIADVRREQEERNDAAASLDDAWERHKAARRQADPSWRDATPPFFGGSDGGGVSPTMEAFAQPDDLPTLESLPPTTMSCTSASTEKTSWSVGGPSDSSLETRQRATKGRCDDITDALTATNLSAAAATTPPVAAALGAWGAPKGAEVGVESNAAVRLFTSAKSLAPAAQPTWGGKPFVDRTTVKGSVYPHHQQGRGPIPRVDTQPMVDDDDYDDHVDPFEELQAKLSGGGAGPFGIMTGREPRHGGSAGKKKKGAGRGKTISLAGTTASTTQPTPASSQQTPSS